MDQVLRIKLLAIAPIPADVAIRTAQTGMRSVLPSLSSHDTLMDVAHLSGYHQLVDDLGTSIYLAKSKSRSL